MDSFDDDTQRETLLEAEREIFKGIKPDVENMFGHSWTGSKEENSEADYRVAMCIKASFKMYESGKKVDGSFFKF